GHVVTGDDGVLVIHRRLLHGDHQATLTALAARSAAPSVSTSKPSAVTSTVCSHCADSEWSLVTTVQPSFNSCTWRLPALIIGSTVKVMPSRSCTPVPGRP